MNACRAGRGTLRLPQSAVLHSIWSVGLCPRSLSLGARLPFRGENCKDIIDKNKAAKVI